MYKRVVKHKQCKHSHIEFNNVRQKIFGKYNHTDKKVTTKIYYAFSEFSS